MLDARGRIAERDVLDVFAGTGALGLEALSRGARSATFVEHAPPALAAIRANIASLGLEARCRVVARRVQQAMPELSEHGYDLVLCDPPWDDVPTLVGTLAELATRLRPEGWLVLEHARRTPAPEILGVQLVETRFWGDTAVSCFEL